MKVTIFKTKGGQIHGWCNGNANYEIKIGDKNEGIYIATKEEIELSDEDSKKIQSFSYEPIYEDGQIILKERQNKIDNRLRKERIKELKNKNMTQDELQEVVKLLL